MVCDEDCRTAVLGKTERTVGWEGDGEPTRRGLVRHCHGGKPAATARPCLRSLSHSFTLDFIMGFEREDDARRVMAVLDKRMGRFGLPLHPDKTRLVVLGRNNPSPYTVNGRPLYVHLNGLAIVLLK
jgi:hypothetical protein